MENLENAKWDFSAGELYAQKWFREHGFSVELVRQYVSKTVYQVSKDGVVDKFELPQGDDGIDWAKYMELYAKAFENMKKMNGVQNGD